MPNPGDSCDTNPFGKIKDVTA
eukprot:SAG22_NODE_13456_length_406_cov_0.674267_1_plen_21_part_10